MSRFGLPSSKQIFSAPSVQNAAAALGAAYLRLVWKTGRFVVDPPDVYDWIDSELPAIIAMWHGQHLMMPFVKRKHHRVKVLISRHRDGEINALVAERLGMQTIRGSGDHRGNFRRKGGVAAFMEMLDALNDNWSVALTADVPKVSRVVGRGIILLARESGRPIYPVAVATHRRIEFATWDRSCLGLPFSRGALVAGDVVRVRADADDTTVEAAREQLCVSLEAATKRAYALAAGRADEVAGG